MLWGCISKFRLMLMQTRVVLVSVCLSCLFYGFICSCRLMYLSGYLLLHREQTQLLLHLCLSKHMGSLFVTICLCNLIWFASFFFISLKLFKFINSPARIYKVLSVKVRLSKSKSWMLGKPCSTSQQRRVQWAQYQQNITTPPQCKQEGEL